MHHRCHHKRLAARFYQLKVVHCPTSQYLARTKKQPTAKCCWCTHRTQVREHISNSCPLWKCQQEILWDLFADERCCQPIFDFLSTADVGRLLLALAEEDAQSEALEWELRERREGEKREGKRLRN